MKDRHLKKLKSTEKLQKTLKKEKREKNPIKLESAKKLTSPARFGSCIFAPIASSRSYPGKQARKSRLELHPGNSLRSFSFPSLSLTCHVGMKGGGTGATCRRGNNTLENSAP